VFIHQTRLSHPLQPHHYTSEEQYRRERERLFLPGWHLVATKAQLRRDGDFLTRELYGQPILLRNFGGEIHAFLNVCAHRHCLLTHQPQGHDPRFRCQYHGWEYTREGRTGKIPDAGCFRPWDRENARLHKFRTATVGDLVFVSLATEGPSVEEYLGKTGAALAASCVPPFRQVWSWQTDYRCNWKLVLENSLESYHMACLHLKSLGPPPQEENCEHVLAEEGTTFHTTEMKPFVRWSVGLFMRRFGAQATHRYTHHHSHPNTTFVALDTMRLVQAVEPTSPNTCHHRAWLFSLHGTRSGPLRALLAWLMKRIVTSVTRRVLLEDASILADVQRGLEASPHRGVLGIREERIHTFHEWILRRCGETNDEAAERR
jgi:phenylpropionate dioxygenase-like ring-hydroxylating dioxygenase large terminal subunit